MPCKRLLLRATLAALLGGLMAWAGTGVTSSGRAQDEQEKKGHPPARVPKDLKYPRGEQIKQVYREPPSMELTAQEGVGVATDEVMGLAAEHPTIKKLELKLRPRFVTRLSAEEEPEPGAEPAAALAPEALEA